MGHYPVPEARVVEMSWWRLVRRRVWRDCRWNSSGKRLQSNPNSPRRFIASRTSSQLRDCRDRRDCELVKEERLGRLDENFVRPSTRQQLIM